VIRCLFYFGFWSLLARFWFKRSTEQDSSAKPDFGTKLQGISAKKRFTFQLGNGSGRLEIESFQGDIQLRRPGEREGSSKSKSKNHDSDHDREHQ